MYSSRFIMQNLFQFDGQYNLDGQGVPVFCIIYLRPVDVNTVQSWGKNSKLLKLKKLLRP